MGDLKSHRQPPSVHERLWTPIRDSNPIWAEYCTLLRALKDETEKGKEQLSGCSNCMTIFTPNFPKDHHLHALSKAFKSATHRKAIMTCDVETLCVPKGESTRLTFQYHALTALAKEAGAYKVVEGVEFIRLIRVVRVPRPHRGQASIERHDICENCQVEELPHLVSERLECEENLVNGILQLIEK